jgi:hypothetical protein
MSTNKWMAKAVGYLIVVDVLLSLLCFVVLKFGANSNLYTGETFQEILQIMLNVAIPVLPLSVGIALREEKQSPTKQGYSKIFLRIGSVLLFLFCLIVLLLTFVHLPM